MKIKLLHVTNMYPTNNNPHMGTFVEVLHNNLIKRGVDCDLYFINSLKSKINYFKAYNDVKKLIKENQYDIIHTQYAHCGFLLSLIKPKISLCHFHGEIGFKKNIKKIQHYDDFVIWLDYLKDYFLAKIASKKNIASVVVKQDDLVFVNSKHNFCIPIGIDDLKFKPKNRIEACNSLGLDENSIKIIFPSNPSRKEKNYYLFKKILNNLKEYFLNVDEIILDKIPHKKIPIFLNACDLLLLTSKSEASPTIIKESLLCNLPIVATNVGDISYQIRGVINCYSSDFNVNKMTNYAISILKHRKRSNGFIKKREKISINQTINLFLNAYSEILNEK